MRRPKRKRSRFFKAQPNYLPGPVHGEPTMAHVIPPCTCGVRAGGARVGCPRTAEPPRRRSPESHHEHEAQTAAAPPRSHYSAAASSPPFECGDCGDRPRPPRCRALSPTTGVPSALAGSSTGRVVLDGPMESRSVSYPISQSLSIECLFSQLATVC